MKRRQFKRARERQKDRAWLERYSTWKRLRVARLRWCLLGVAFLAALFLLRLWASR